MRKLLVWILAALGGAALIRKLRRKGRDDVTVAPTDAGGDPADELRRTLADSRSDEPVLADTAPAESEATVDEERSEVHDRARSVLDEMQGPGTDDE